MLGIVLLLLFGYGFSWIFALVGLFSSSPETANSIGFTAIFPLTFASSAFVPAASMPNGLRQFAEVNPFTTVVGRRALAVARHAGEHGRVDGIVWCGVLLAVFPPVAVRRYRQVGGREAASGTLMKVRSPASRRGCRDDRVAAAAGRRRPRLPRRLREASAKAAVMSGSLGRVARVRVSGDRFDEPQPAHGRPDGIVLGDGFVLAESWIEGGAGSRARRPRRMTSSCSTAR